MRSKDNSEFRIPNSALNFKGFCKIVDLFVNERIDERTLRSVFFGENFTLNAYRVEERSLVVGDNELPPYCRFWNISCNTFKKLIQALTLLGRDKNCAVIAGDVRTLGQLVRFVENINSGDTIAAKLRKQL